jgi:2-polyprenyl-3-methyl-5-hydroxy-6-metoxy-1,4-benzoquinol methylase
MIIATGDLDNFIARSDALGGPSVPACNDYWAGVEYRPETKVDETLDPFGPEYAAQQLAVYREISGRDLDQLVNEHTTLDVAFHAAAANPYANITPGGVSLHIERLARAIKLGAPPLGGRLLDMGCGWGLSSELASYSGMKVFAFDVNPDFVDLVNRRAQRMSNGIVAQQGMFDNFESDLRFDMILFYECFHHALRPWDLLARMRRHLAPNGKIVMAGEPIQAHWWRHWGMRLDPLSIYCIRKFGWLENGWSIEFLRAAFERAALNIRVNQSADGDIGYTVVGSRTEMGRTSAADIGQHWSNSGWLHDGGYMICKDDSRLTFMPPEGANKLRLGFLNFRDKPVQLQICKDDRVVFQKSLPPGRNDIELTPDTANGTLRFNGELWTPNDELHNGDTRTISLHLEDVTFA